MPEQRPSADLIRRACGLAKEMCFWAVYEQPDEGSVSAQKARLPLLPVNREFAIGQRLAAWRMLGASRFAIFPDLTHFKRVPQEAFSQCQFPDHLWSEWSDPVMVAFFDLVVAVWQGIEQPTINSLGYDKALIDKIQAASATLSTAVEDHDYNEPRTPDEWAKVFDQSCKTIRRRIDAKQIRAIEVHSKSWRIHRADIPAVAVR